MFVGFFNKCNNITKKNLKMLYKTKEFKNVVQNKRIRSANKK